MTIIRITDLNIALKTLENVTLNTILKKSEHGGEIANV